MATAKLLFVVAGCAAAPLDGPSYEADWLSLRMYSITADRNIGRTISQAPGVITQTTGLLPLVAGHI